MCVGVEVSWARGRGSSWFGVWLGRVLIDGGIMHHGRCGEQWEFAVVGCAGASSEMGFFYMGLVKRTGMA